MFLCFFLCAKESKENLLLLFEKKDLTGDRYLSDALVRDEGLTGTCPLSGEAEEGLEIILTVEDIGRGAEEGEEKEDETHLGTLGTSLQDGNRR